MAIRPLPWGRLPSRRYAVKVSSRQALPWKRISWKLPPFWTTSLEPGSASCMASPPSYGVAASSVAWKSRTGGRPLPVIFSRPAGLPWYGQNMQAALYHMLL